MSSAAKHSTSAVRIGTLPSRFIVAIICAPSAASPDSTTSIGGERHAGKNGWLTKQRAGCFALAAICARGRPEVAKPIRQLGATTASSLPRIACLIARSSLAASRTYSQSLSSARSRVGTSAASMAAATFGDSLPRATPFEA